MSFPRPRPLIKRVSLLPGNYHSSADYCKDRRWVQSLYESKQPRSSPIPSKLDLVIAKPLFYSSRYLSFANITTAKVIPIGESRSSISGLHTVSPAPTFKSYRSIRTHPIVRGRETSALPSYHSHGLPAGVQHCTLNHGTSSTARAQKPHLKHTRFKRPVFGSANEGPRSNGYSSGSWSTMRTSRSCWRYFIGSSTSHFSSMAVSSMAKKVLLE